MSLPAYAAKVRERLLTLMPPPSDRPFVLLVTGSRRAEVAIWKDVVAECLVEVDVWLKLHTPTNVARVRILRHGGAPGIDTIAHIAGRRARYSSDRMPADWGYWGRRSGIIRNGHMVAKEPTPSLCLAFFASPRSAGTADCAAQARNAGIPTIPITVEDLYLPHRS